MAAWSHTRRHSKTVLFHYSSKCWIINWTQGSVTYNRPEAEASSKGREAHGEEIASREHARSKTRGSKEQAAWCQHLAPHICSLFSDKALSTKVEHSLSFHRLTYCSLQTMPPNIRARITRNLYKPQTQLASYYLCRISKTETKENIVNPDKVLVPWVHKNNRVTNQKHSGHVDTEFKNANDRHISLRISFLADVSNISFKLGYASLPSSPHLHIFIFIFQEAAHLQSISVVRKVRLHPMRSHSVKSSRDGPSPMLLAVGTRQK